MIFLLFFVSLFTKNALISAKLRNKCNYFIRRWPGTFVIHSTQFWPLIFFRQVWIFLWVTLRKFTVSVLQLYNYLTLNVHSTFTCCQKVDLSTSTVWALSVRSSEIIFKNSTSINRDDITNLLRYVFMSQKGCFGHSELYKLEWSNELFNYRWSWCWYINKTLFVSDWCQIQK